MIVVLDPFAVVPVFVALVQDRNHEDRHAIARRAVYIAFFIALFFLVAGRLMLTELGVSLDAFRISGGVLLFLTALPMLFGERGGLMSAGDSEQTDDAVDVSVFPLAIPLISGPGMLTTVLVLAASAQRSLAKGAVLVLALVVVFVITAFVLKHGSALILRIGQSGVHVVTRVLGIVLAAIAAQFVLTGINGFAHGLH